MRNRLVITLCAVVSLLAGAGLLTFWLVRSLAPAAALKLLPYLEGVFARYPLSDDFAYSPEYEQFCTELTGAILISLEENGL